MCILSHFTKILKDQAPLLSSLSVKLLYYYYYTIFTDNHSNDLVKLLRCASPSAFSGLLLCFIVHFYLFCLSVCMSLCVCVRAMLPDSNKMMMMMMISLSKSTGTESVVGMVTRPVLMLRRIRCLFPSGGRSQHSTLHGWPHTHEMHTRLRPDVSIFHSDRNLHVRT